MLTAKCLVSGNATGTALVITHPLCISGGVGVTLGEIKDSHSPHFGLVINGKILVMPRGRGSSTASNALAELLRLGIGPRGIILLQVDQILAIGSIVSRTLYKTACPVVVADPADYNQISTGDIITIQPDGLFSVNFPEVCRNDI